MNDSLRKVPQHCVRLALFRRRTWRASAVTAHSVRLSGVKASAWHAASSARGSGLIGVMVSRSHTLAISNRRPNA